MEKRSAAIGSRVSRSRIHALGDLDRGVPAVGSSSPSGTVTENVTERETGWLFERARSRAPPPAGTLLTSVTSNVRGESEAGQPPSIPHAALTIMMAAPTACILDGECRMGSPC